MQDELVAISSPFAKDLAAAELESLRRLAGVLERFDAKRERDFAMVIASVLRSRFTQRELAETFKVSVGTISRWAAGVSAPPSYARGVIVSTLRDMLAGSAGSLIERLADK
jgi:hypothetical protein